ncbi:MAG: tRNA pseudouridine(55) synthase TruB [Zoogloeaceae bacterium]|nr:tRNA pseudouridine(55) synthase TruB [Zoogloeaceae bacterium]
MGRRKGLAIDGVLLLDKPRGISSNAALQRVRRAYGAAKAGHTGTLDPMAQGLLPIALGEATKFSQFLLDADKTYLAEIQLGAVTDTGDAEGQILARFEHHPTPDDVAMACLRRLGPQMQTPPRYSALKHQGRPLYEYARAGEDVVKAPRAVTIHQMDLLSCSPEGRVQVRVRCSKGTYIRVLAEEVGQDLGCGAYLAALTREATGPFRLASAVALDVLVNQPAEEAMGRLQPVDAFVEHMPILRLSTAISARIRFGQTILPSEWDGIVPADAHWRLYDGDAFLGIGRTGLDGALAPIRLVSTRQGGNKGRLEA